MTTPEHPNSPQHSRNPLSNFWRRIQRSDSGDVPAAPPAAPEKTPHDIHRERVAGHIRTLFDAVDTRVAYWIGYSGNIREELKDRITPTGRYQQALNTQNLDPAIQSYMRANIFFFRHDSDEGGPAAIYKIDCQLDRFLPSIYVETPDGAVEATLFAGQDNNQFHSVQLKRIYNDRRVRHLSTFSASSNAYDPPHPLEINQGTLPMPYCNAVYDGIDDAGNVSLLDQQYLTDPSGRAAGKYSAANHTIASLTSEPFPYSRDGEQLLIGSANRQVAIPLQTNIYSEMADISEVIRTITP